MAGHGTWHAVLLAAPAVVLLLASAAGAQSKCDKLRFQAAGNAARLAAICAADAAAAGTPVDTACLEVAAERLRRKWERATARGDCTAPADAEQGVTAMNDFVAALTTIVQPQPRCCTTATGCFAAPSIDAANCQFELLGTPGAPGSVCDGATGTCVPAPGTGGPCCTLESLTVCASAPGGDPAVCESAGGTYLPTAVCEPSGSCVPR
jgi:hypothetical protein